MPELTAPAEMISCSLRMETPAFAAVASASAVADAIDIAMKLLMSFSVCP